MPKTSTGGSKGSIGDHPEFPGVKLYKDAPGTESRRRSFNWESNALQSLARSGAKGPELKEAQKRYKAMNEKEKLYKTKNREHQER